MGDLRFEYNATNSNKVVSLGASYMDVKGTSYSGNVTLAPYTSLVLIYASGSTAQAAGNTEEITNENGLNIDKQSFMIAPNPVTENFTLQLNNSHTGRMGVKIINQLGQVMRSFMFEKNQSYYSESLHSSGLPKGTYFLHVQIGNWVETRKILKL